MKTLVYKRTHHGDPDGSGIFGINDCMGEVRWWDFDAVIGVGGQGPEAVRSGVAGKVNWIGIGPHKSDVGLRGPLVTFDHFILFPVDDSPDFKTVAPILANRFYTTKPRTVMTFTTEEQFEVDHLLKLAATEPPSPAVMASMDTKLSHSCAKCHC